MDGQKENSKPIKLKGFLEQADQAHKLDDFTREIKFLKQALRLTNKEKDIASIYEKIGTALLFLGKADEAKHNFLLALDRFSELSEEENRKYAWLANDYLGGIFYEEGNYKRALAHKIKAYQSIEYIQPKDSFLLFLRIADIHENLKDYDKAIDFYLKALEVPEISNDDRALASQCIGQIYDRIGEERKAFKYFHRVFEINPDYEAGWYLIYRFAQLAYRFRNYEQSKEYFNKAISKIPADQPGYLQLSFRYLGYYYLTKNDHKRAIIEFKKALKIQSDLSNNQAYIYCGLSQAYFGLNQIRKAIKFALKALDQHTDNEIEERIYFLLSYSYSLKGDEEKSELYSQKLRELNPKSGYLRELE